MKKPAKKVRATQLPLTVNQVRRRMDKDGFIKFVVAFDLDELMNPIDLLNDVCSAHASGGDETMLEDISYRPVGIAKDKVLVEITGNVQNWLAQQVADSLRGLA